MLTAAPSADASSAFFSMLLRMRFTSESSLMKVKDSEKGSMAHFSPRAISCPSHCPTRLLGKLPRLDQVPLHLQRAALRGHHDLLAVDLLLEGVADVLQAPDELEAALGGGALPKEMEVHLEAGGRIEDVVEEDPLQGQATLLIADVDEADENEKHPVDLEGGRVHEEIVRGTAVRGAHGDVAFADGGLARALRFDDGLRRAAESAALRLPAPGIRVDAAQDLSRPLTAQLLHARRADQLPKGAVGIDDLPLLVDDPRRHARRVQGDGARLEGMNVPELGESLGA